MGAIIANVNRDLARKASALSASLAAMNAAAAIAAHNNRVDASNLGVRPVDRKSNEDPNTPPEKEPLAGDSAGATDVLRRDTPEETPVHDIAARASHRAPTNDDRIQAPVRVTDIQEVAIQPRVPDPEPQRAGRGHRQKKRRLMADGSFAVEPSRIDARASFETERRPDAVRSTVPKVPKPQRPTPKLSVVLGVVKGVGASRPAPLSSIPSKETFQATLDAFLARRDGQPPRTPIFNKAGVDMRVVFCEVQSLGGYDAVTRDKRWKRVCEALGRDLTTATSAGHSMRVLYEKYLLDFEVHLAGESDDPARGKWAAHRDARAERDEVITERATASTRRLYASGPEAVDDDDVDDATLERLRFALRAGKAELEARLSERERRARSEARHAGGNGDANAFVGCWLSFGDSCPLFDGSRAFFARELPDSETEKPRWAQCQLCAGWRDLGVPGTRKSATKRQLPRSARARARMEREANGIAARHGGWRPGVRLGSNFSGFAEAEDWRERKVTAADLEEAARLAASATLARPKNPSELANAVDTLALAATAIVTEVRPDVPFRNMVGTLESVASAALRAVAKKDREMFDADASKGATRDDAFHQAFTAVVRKFAENRVPIVPDESAEVARDALSEGNARSKDGVPEKDVLFPRPKSGDDKVNAAAMADAETARVMAEALGERAVPAVPIKPAPEAPAAPAEATTSAPRRRAPEARDGTVSHPLKREGPDRPSEPLKHWCFTNVRKNPSKTRVLASWSDGLSNPNPSPSPSPVETLDPKLDPIAAPAPKPKLRFVIKKSAARLGEVSGSRETVPGAGNGALGDETSNSVDAMETHGNGGDVRNGFEETKRREPGATTRRRFDSRGDPPRPKDLCACVPLIPEGWHRWEAIRKKPNANGTWAADCYYKSPPGPMGTWKTFILRSDEEICQFLKADAAQPDSVFQGLTAEFFNCKPFTRRKLLERSGTGADPFVSGGALTHKWRAELVAPFVQGMAASESDSVPLSAGGRRASVARKSAPVAARPAERVADVVPSRFDDDDAAIVRLSSDEYDEDIASTDSEDEEAAIAAVTEGPLWE